MSEKQSINSYRLLDASYGTLETAVRLQNELVKSRLEQVEARKKSLIERFMLVVATLVAGIPVLHQLFPKDWGNYQNLLVWTFASAVVGYLGVGIYQLIADSDNDKELRKFLKSNRLAARKLDDDPLFLQLQISTFLTRRTLAQEIVEESSNDAIVARYQGFADYWKQRAEKAMTKIEALKDAGVVDDAKYEEVRGWYDSVQ